MVLSNKLIEAKRLLNFEPDYWKELEDEKIDGIIADALERKINPTVCRQRVFRHIPVGSKFGKEIMVMYGSITEKERKTKVRTIRFTPYEDEILNKFVAYGGKRTQLIMACIQKIFSEIGTEPDCLLDFVKSWHGVLWRNKLDNKAFYEYAMKYDKTMLKSDAIGIPDNTKNYKKQDPNEIVKETIDFIKEKRDAEINSKIIPKRERVPNLSPEKKAEIEEVKRNQQKKERKRKLEPKKSLIEKELEADKNFKPNTTEEVLEFIELQKQKAEIEKKMKLIGKKKRNEDAER